MVSITIILRITTVALLVLLLAGCSEKDPDTLDQTLVPDSSTTDESFSESSPQNTPLLTYEERQGKQVYTKYCVVCHGEAGEGDGFNSYNLSTRPRDFTDAKYMNSMSDDRIAEAISQGGRGVNRLPLMPSWGGRLTKREIQNTVSYVRALGRFTNTNEE